MKVNGFTDGRQNGTAAVGLLLVCQATVQAVYRRDAIARYCEQIRVGVTHGNICLTTIGQGDHCRRQRTAEGRGHRGGGQQQTA